MTEEIQLDSFQPDYVHECEVCGQTPIVTGVKDGKTVYSSGMCGPCTFGEAAMLDPKEWNE